MMVVRRRMTFQLTPLLDLLLIIIFAQFMEMRDATARTESEVRQEAAARMVELDREHQARLDEVAAHRQELTDRFRDILKQQEGAGNILAEIFNIPDRVITDVLKLRDPTQPQSQAQQDALRRRIEEFRERRGRSIIKHLMTWDEVRKHCDVWELYVTENGSFQLSSGTRMREFRGNTAAEFSQRMYDAYKSFDEPRSLVVILVSYGDASFRIRRLAINTMRKVVARMREDRGLRNWFEYAIVGFSPDGPAILKERNDER